MVKYSTFPITDFFKISKTKSFNKDRLTKINSTEEIFDYVTRTSQNRGILEQTGFVNSENINEADTYSLGLLQMDFFHRDRRWYAGQFVRKIVPKIKLTRETALYFETVLQKTKPILLSVLIRDVDKTFNKLNIELPVLNSGEPDYDYMTDYVKRIEADYVKRIEAYLTVLGYPDVKSARLTETDRDVLNAHSKAVFGSFKVGDLFSFIKRGKRIKSADRVSGSLPFITAGVGEMGLSAYIGNVEAEHFSSNSLTIDMFGTTYYRGYTFGADDHVTVLHSDDPRFNKHVLQYIQPNIEKAITGQFSYSKNFYAKDAYDIEIKLPIKSCEPDFDLMDKYISVLEKKSVLKLKLNLDNQLKAYKSIV